MNVGFIHGQRHFWGKSFEEIFPFMNMGASLAILHQLEFILLNYWLENINTCFPWNMQLSLAKHSEFLIWDTFFQKIPFLLVETRKDISRRPKKDIWHFRNAFNKDSPVFSLLALPRNSLDPNFQEKRVDSSVKFQLLLLESSPPSLPKFLIPFLAKESPKHMKTTFWEVKETKRKRRGASAKVLFPMVCPLSHSSPWGKKQKMCIPCSLVKKQCRPWLQKFTFKMLTGQLSSANNMTKHPRATFSSLVFPQIPFLIKLNLFRE